MRQLCGSGHGGLDRRRPRPRSSRRLGDRLRPCGQSAVGRDADAGAVVYALTAALYGEITIKDGVAEQSNFNDYKMMRMAEAPEVVSVIVPSGDFWGGVGEPPVPPVAPALCNAIFAATGKRIRALPVMNH